jgi:hypothetical protein
MPASPGRGRVGTGRDPASHPVQPTGQRVAVADRSGLADQDQEGRLESILGIMRLAKGRLTDAEHHRAVSLNKGRERKLGGLACAGRKPLQQLSVRQPSECPYVEECTDVPEGGAVSSLCH